MSSFSEISIVFLLVAANFYEAECLLCYECKVQRTDNGQQQNLTCVEAPWNIPGSVKTCLPHMKACKTVRTNSKKSGRIVAFERGCSPNREDSVDEGMNYIIYSRYCFTNKCNTGDGMGNDKGTQNKRIVAILIKDITNAGYQVYPPYSLLIFSIVFSYYGIY